MHLLEILLDHPFIGGIDFDLLFNSKVFFFIFGMSCSGFFTELSNADPKKHPFKERLLKLVFNANL